MKRVLRIRGCIFFDTDNWSEEQIIALLKSKVGMYALVTTANMSLSECPENFKPKQKTLNGFLKLFKKK